ncbi:MAG TPA: hypothetical protein VG148_05885 [Pyrinomonadaceae bacterium]|nr:hypothetical protein [Pyrinomonadaceae bacterium]
MVDASVAGAAGGKTATALVSKDCRAFLEALRRETECCIVLPPGLRDEWDRHRSGFAATWLVSMTSRRRVIPDEVPPSRRMRREVEKAAANQRDLKALRKDFHLVEAAVATDRTVVSLDEVVRRLFKAAAQSVAAIKKVVWVNPSIAAEQPVRWLRNGAKPENARMLGHLERGR